MNLQLEGKQALITGSTAGIGFAIAQGLAKEGAAVIVNGRTAKRVDQALAALEKAGVLGKLEGLAADLGTAEGTHTVIERFPEVDILVNNVGIFEIKPFENIPDADWLRLFEVNILSGVRLSRHYLPGMKQRNWGMNHPPHKTASPQERPMKHYALIFRSTRTLTPEELKQRQVEIAAWVKQVTDMGITLDPRNLGETAANFSAEGN